MAPLREIRIDERTWSSAGPARRGEWRAIIHELLEPGRTMMRSEAHRLHITVTEQASLLEAVDASGRSVCDVTVPKDALADLVTEYVDIVRQIAKEDAPGGLARLEALDMAKKVTHDRGGRTLKRYCRSLEMDLPTARRLFTLLLSLRIDTTRLVGVHGHRRVR